MKIAIDLDEVVTEYIEMYLKFHRKTFGEIWKKSQFFSYNFWEVFGNKKEVDVARHNQFYKSAHFDLIEPAGGAIEAIKKLTKDHEIRIITARPSAWRRKTYKWIKKYLGSVPIKVDFAGLVHLDGQAGKGVICQKYGINLILEDAANYAQDCADKGIRVILFDKPWNQDVKNQKNIIRVKNWAEALQQIQA